ncbi:MAG: hypothetical protein HRT63_13615 [Erythrobacter sp.]|nr:hypothetical protein [Erythrobacter sp.]
MPPARWRGRAVVKPYCGIGLDEPFTIIAGIAAGLAAGIVVIVAMDLGSPSSANAPAPATAPAQAAQDADAQTPLPGDTDLEPSALAALPEMPATSPTRGDSSAAAGLVNGANPRQPAAQTANLPP